MPLKRRTDMARMLCVGVIVANVSSRHAEYDEVVSSQAHILPSNLHAVMRITEASWG